MKYDFLYDVMEKPLTRYVSVATQANRYDFGLLYSQHFDGKSIILSLQTWNGVLLSFDEIFHHEAWAKKLGIVAEDVEAVKEFLKATVNPQDRLADQY